MGPTNFHNKFICRNDHEKRNNKRQHNLADILAGTQGNVGLDLSCTIYNCLCTVRGAGPFDSVPKVPLYDALNKIMAKVQSLVDMGAKNRLMVFVDGLPPPMKEAGAGTTRESRRNTALERLDEIYSNGDADYYEEVKKLRTSIVYRREDLTAMIINECRKMGVKIFAAPFEADWQLVSAQVDNLIDVIISDDGDLFIIGGDNIVTDLDYETGECCFYKRDEILQRESMGSGVYANELPALSNFVGNDYISNLYNVGEKTAHKYIKQFIDGDELQRKTFIDELQITRKWKATDNFAEGFSDKFWCAYYLQKFPPVFRLKPKSQDEPLDINNDETYDVVLESMHTLPSDVSTPEQWGNMIGFDGDPSELLPASCTEKELFLLESMPQTGNPPQLLEQPKSEFPPHYPIAHGATPSENIPVELWSDWSITKFLVERRLRLRGKYNRQKSIRLVKRILILMKEQGQRAPQPREWTEEHETAYDEDIALTTRGNGQTLLWNVSWDEVLSVIDKVEAINDKDFFKLFGKGCNGIQERAKRLIIGGHFNIGKIQTAQCRIKSNGHDAMAIRMECVPSMKSDPYWVMLVCDLETNEFIPAPTSRCGCPAGLGGCSHLRTEYAIFSKLKSILSCRKSIGETLTQDEACSFFPACMQSMAKIPIPWKYVFHDDKPDKELKRMKRQQQIQNRNNSRTLNSILTSLNSGAGIPDDSESDEDDEDYCPTDDTTEVDEETLLELATEDDGEEQIEGNDIDDLIDTMTPQPENELCRDIKLCEFVSEHVDAAATRARVLEDSNGEQVADYKMERSKLHKNLRNLLDGKDGPNESIQSKLRQLLQQEALHKRFAAGKIEKCLLSYYLLHTREQRLVLIHQFKEAVKQGKSKKDVTWMAVRLEKLPVGFDGLGDRGFAETSVSYPNFNNMQTPEFLEGREQFTFGETVGTRDLAQSRYGSEAVNKRTNDWNYIRDKMPRANFKHAEAVLKWAMFNANLCQPFLIPHGAGNYFPGDTTHLQRPCKRARANLSILSQPAPTEEVHSPSWAATRPLNFIDVAMPQRYYDVGLEKVGLLMDGKDCVTDTVRISTLISRALYSDKMHSSAARYILWVLPCGLTVTCTPLFLGRVSETALVEYWGGSTYDLLCD